MAKKTASRTGKAPATAQAAPPRSWRGLVALSREAIDALELGDTRKARSCLEAIRAIASQAAETYRD